jgi:hypothetical protein
MTRFSFEVAETVETGLADEEEALFAEILGLNSPMIFMVSPTW